jgi:hypothetical protein
MGVYLFFAQWRVLLQTIYGVYQIGEVYARS